MIAKTARLSSKGQITLPAEALRAIGARKGDDFLVIQHGGRLTLVPVGDLAAKEIEDSIAWSLASLASMADIWDNPDDEVWNDA